MTAAVSPPAWTITLDDIDPSMLVSANRRIHHQERARICRYWRALAYHYGIGVHVPITAFPRQARAVVTVRFPDRRRRDVGNLYPYVAKPAIDGLVDAGWLVDDSDDCLVGPDLRRDPVNGPHRVVIRIEAA